MKNSLCTSWKEDLAAWLTPLSIHCGNWQSSSSVRKQTKFLIQYA